MRPKSSNTLESWIKIATNGLPPTVQSRLKNEIEDHYASLLEKQLGEGQSQTLAEATALQQLGQASEVAKNYRDAHFSRDRYLRAMWAVLTLLAIHIINSITWAMGRGIEARTEFVYYDDKFLYFDQYVEIWNVITSVVTLILILMIARGISTLLKESWDVKISSGLYRLFMVSVCCSTIAMALYTATDWFEWSHLYDTRVQFIVSSGFWQPLRAVTAAFIGLSPVALGSSLIGVAFTIWKSIYKNANTLAQAFALMLGGVGAAIIFNMLLTLNIIPIGMYRIERYYLPFVMPVLLALFGMLLFILGMIFRIMSISGRTLAGNGEE